MTQIANEMDKRLQSFLDRLRPAPPMDVHTAELERANFLAQVERLRATVSPQPEVRQMKWIDKIKLTYQRKEQSPMLSTILTIVIAVSILFGGAGTTAYAAQTSLPDQPLYPLKTWSEGVRLRLENSPQDQIQLILRFTNQRMEEISGLLTAGKPIPASVIERFQEELDWAMQLSVGMDEPEMLKALEQIRFQAENQVQAVIAWMKNGTAQGDPALERLLERLREQARLSGLGETNPDALRQQIRDRDRLKAPLQTPRPTQTGAGKQNPTVTPAGANKSYGPGPFPTNVTPGGFGPGPQLNAATCTPVLDGTGPGPGPNPTGTASGATGAGPGPHSQNLTSTPEPPGNPGAGQSSPTAQEKGNPGNGQPTDPPGNGGKP